MQFTQQQIFYVVFQSLKGGPVLTSKEHTFHIKTLHHSSTLYSGNRKMNYEPPQFYHSICEWVDVGMSRNPFDLIFQPTKKNAAALAI